jgi:predicted metalloprotease with PDZ domain
LGCQLVEYNNSRDAYLGADTKTTEGSLLVSLVYRDGPAYNQGLNVNDEIVAIDGGKVPANVEALNRIMSTKAPNDVINLTVVRDGLIKNLSIQLGQNPNKTYKIQRVANPTAEQEALYNKWLFIDNK